MLYSFVTVFKDDFERLLKTIDSLLGQRCNLRFHHHVQLCNPDRAVIEYLTHLQRISYDHYVLTYCAEPDEGIYDGMNRSLRHTRGNYLIFLNCGDTLVHANSISHLTQIIEHEIRLVKDLQSPDLIALSFVYSREGAGWDICGYRSFTNALESGFLICQQSLMYSRHYLLQHNFNTKYRLAGDYEHSLGMLRDNAKILDIPYALVNYEAGGLSEACSVEASKEIQIIRMAFHKR